MDWVTALGALGVGGVLGSLVQNWLTDRRENAKRKLEFIKQQLQEFYGPLLSLHKEIRAHSQLRVKLQQALDDQHISAMLRARPGEVEAASDPYIPAIHENLLDENKTFKELLMPKYRYMVTIFQQKMWLAEPETRPFLPKLVEFVYVWDKILNGRLPPEIAGVIGHTEENLKPFCTHLEQMHDRLRSKIS